MSNLVPRVSDAAMAYQARADLQPELPKRVRRAVDAQIARGLIGAARAQADAYAARTRLDNASYVARTGMRQVAELGDEEARYTARNPLSEYRYRAIADAFTTVVCNEVTNLGYDR